MTPKGDTHRARYLRDYMREYMRAKRAGQKPQPKAGDGIAEPRGGSRELETAKARIAELEKALARVDLRHKLAQAQAKRGAEPQATASDGTAETAALKAENAALKATIATLERQMFAPQQPREPARRAAKPKVEKAPLPPDEVRERQIKSLTTRVRNLTGELRETRRWQEHEQETKGVMSYATMSAISKALHPDHQLTEAEREVLRVEGLKKLNTWKADAAEARRPEDAKVRKPRR
jgi:hypothetical protein